MTLKALFIEMMEDYLNETREDDYHRMIHTGELPKERISKKPKLPTKSYDDLRDDLTKIRKVEKHPHDDRFKIHYSTSSNTPKNILKKSGWEHTAGTLSPYGSNSKLVYSHPDGHTATYYHDAHTIHLKKN